MKKYTLQYVFICCFTIVAELQAQGWIRLNPTFDPPGNYNTNRGFFVDEKNGWWFVGPPKAVWRTTNGGSHWKEQAEIIVWGKIEFIDTLRGWVIGESLPDHKHYITITKDGGRSWAQYSSPFLICITFFDCLNGFAGGQGIYETTDGGITWEPQIIEAGQGVPGIADIYFIDRKHGWAVGGRYIHTGVILSTVDSGKTWQYNETETILGYAVHFTDSLHGYVAGTNPPFYEGMVQVTSDGGKTWLIHHLAGPWLYDVIFTDDNTGWAIGAYGYIWQTTDRGISWTRVESGTRSHLYSIFFFNGGKTGYILGADSTLLRYERTTGIREDGSLEKSLLRIASKLSEPVQSSNTNHI